MKTVTFKSVLNAVAFRMGLDPDVNLRGNESAAITEYINTHIRRYWEMFEWYQLMKLEKRYYRYAYDVAATYATGDEIYWTDDKYYRSLEDANIGNLPSDDTKWEEATDLDPYVLEEQTGFTPIAEVLEMWEDDPRVTRAAKPVKWWNFDDRIQISLPAPAFVWIYYRPYVPEFTSVNYSATYAYVVDELAYWPSTGECYKCIQASTGNDPDDTDYWLKIDFPYIFKLAVQCAAYAETLSEDGQNTKAASLILMAENYITDEMEKIVRQERQQGKFALVA